MRTIYDFDGLISLLCAVFNLAHKDAKQGREDALQWLDCVVPTWREVSQQEALGSTEAGVAAYSDYDGAIVAPGASCEAVHE